MTDPWYWLFDPATKGLVEVAGDDPRVWTLPKGIELWTQIDGRTPVGTVKKLNPLWAIFGNEVDPVPPAWSNPDLPQWLRNIFWWFRNPAENMKGWVVGLRDQNGWFRIYRRDGIVWHSRPAGPGLPANRDDGRHWWFDLAGWELGEFILHDGRRFPWVSYSDDKAVAYWGWQPDGTGAVKLVKRAAWAFPLLPILALAQAVWRLTASVGPAPRIPRELLEAAAKRATSDA